MNIRAFLGLNSQKKRKGLRLVQMIYILKTFGLGIGFFFVKEFFEYYNVPDSLWGLGVYYAFFWPHIGYQIALRQSNPAKGEVRNLLFDTFFIGFVCAGCHFNPLLTVVMMTMFTLNNIASGGIKVWAIGVLLFVLGAILGYWVYGFQFDPNVTIDQVYLLTPIIFIYPAAIGYSAFKVAITINKRREEFLALSRFDGLTSLYGKKYWHERLGQEFIRSKRQGFEAALVIIDLDYFKDINDNYGHHAGDKTIIDIANSMTSNVREMDVCGRVGGDEFALILPSCTESVAENIAQRIQRDFAKKLEGNEFNCTLSIGIAMNDLTLKSAVDWYKQADKALYHAKESGRNRISVFGK